MGFIIARSLDTCEICGINAEIITDVANKPRVFSLI